MCFLEPGKRPVGDMMQHVMTTYGRQAIAFSRGEGSWLWDLKGKRYLDCVSGVAVSGIGHAHEAKQRNR